VRYIKLPYALGLKIHKNCPQFARPLLDTILEPIPRSVLLGSGFNEKLQLLCNTANMRHQELVAFQEKRLYNLINHAYRNVHYYHKLFKEKNLIPADIRKIDDLKKIPLIKKEYINNNFDSFTSSDYSLYNPGIANTSGTTGKPLTFYLDQQNREIEYASVWRQAFWAGVNNINTKVATFRGDFVFDIKRSAHLYRLDGISKEFVFNTYLLNRDNVIAIIDKLNEFKPELIKGFPHSLYIIAKLASEKNRFLKFKPKIIQTSSETLYSFMRDEIEEFFGAKVFDWYGQSEYVLSICQCEYGTYHQIMETGVMQIIEDDFGFERLVGTGLWNYSMPFINYGIGDIIKSDDITECCCKRGLKIVKSLEGRVNDVVVTPSEKHIGGVAFEHYWKHRVIPKLKYIPDYIHFKQIDLFNLEMEIYSRNPLQDREIKMILKELHEMLDHEMNITINYLDLMPEIKKWQLVESKLKLEDIDIF
jgi:phenylacetate-CoA ligase